MMPLLDKLLPLKKSSLRESVGNLVSGARTAENDRNSVSLLGADQVRILLFRECEWRGRKLLFDSMTVQKHQSKSETVCTVINNNAEGKCETSFNIGTTRDFEQNAIEDDVNLLSEMVFGTVAMTYRGSSFKVHSMNSPPCIMCTKIFPATEHSTCKINERILDEGRSMHVDSASSNTSMRSSYSRPSSGNLSGNDLHAGPRKNSTCSSIGSGLDIDVTPRTGSSQSLESNSSSGIGSLTSLRRRWLRAVSTSLGRSDSDDAFGMLHWSENGNDGRDGYRKRHKTRLGLTMLVRLAQGHESQVKVRLLEHMALLEGMLDRLRYFCIETNKVNGSTCKIQLADRICGATSRFVISLLHILLNVSVDVNTRAPLLWHDVLLNSVTVYDNTNVLHRSLQQMCQLFDELDTKSTNFFLSTVVTAVLTYHLGWIYTVQSPRDRQMIEKLGNLYSCNPLWAQLGDLYGALGNPVKVAHTVVAGDPRKTDLINSVLSFLSYFIRSGMIQKSREYRCSLQQDVQMATNLLEQACIKRPHLFANRRSTCAFNDRDAAIRRCESRVLPSRKLTRSPDTNDISTLGDGIVQYPVERSRISRSVSPLKRSGTMKSGLDTLMTKSTEASVDFKLPAKEFSPRENDGTEKYEQNAQSVKDNERTYVSSKVKIIVSEIESQENVTSKREYQPQNHSEYPLLSFEKKLNALGSEENLAAGKAELQHPFDDNVDPLKMFYNRPELPLNVDGGFVDDFKESQVFFTLGGEDKSVKLPPRPRFGNTCQCSYTFTKGVPSTSAQLPEGVLRKIIQRNFPESSKSIQPPPGATSGMAASSGFCLKCNGRGYIASQDYDGNKQVLETPTNATEVLRTGSSEGGRSIKLARSNSLEALMEANSVVELPMPQSRKISSNKGLVRETDFTKTLVRNKIMHDETNTLDMGYTWGLVLQGVTKKKKRRKRKKMSEYEKDNAEIEPEEKWWSYIREEVMASVRFPIIDQPVAEALCVLADLDTWHVGVLSNNTPCQSPPLPVGMSRLVSNMLESFAYVWRNYHSPVHCIAILEAKLRELWLRSEALAEMMMTVEVCDTNVNTLTNALDLDAADIPLLLAVATTHSPEITQRFGHDACCNCCCCCMPQPTYYKYIQPEVSKSFAPLRYYSKSDVPMEKDTTYRLSYWEGPSSTVEPIRPEDNLICGDAPISDETTHKMSYFGNWCVKTDPPITPCDRQLLGRGPMEDVTTHKHDYLWKYTDRIQPIKVQDNLYCPCAALSDDTTYRLSYYNSSCLFPTPSYAPIKKYVQSDIPMEDYTTYKLSYWPNEIPIKEEQPKREYCRPVTPMDGCTTYRLSYWPHCGEKPPEPFIQPENENLLNGGCCFDDNTTYRLSYFGCGGDKPPDPIRQPGNIIFSPCPLSHDTVNRLSFLGNWCIKQETPITPCHKELLGRGPMQDETTQKHDYTWKRVIPPTEFRPENNLTFSPSPLESCTTHRLSYISNNHECLLPNKSYAPICKYQQSDVPMESETTMRLSYQPVESADQIEKSCSVSAYYPPVNPMEDNTTYNLSYIPPGTLVPLSSCSTSCRSVKDYEMSPQQPCSAS